ncbi:MAG: OmpA family protein [Flavobacterium sp.]|uniref:OmpA family protein n=1 Tax=Flavobacterium sp. TaxID=239 RepID=UPI00120D07FD|nr:OmpA family protein [Flavobacterium sp.]RZJ67453.1 MAG: OmpA family protein [Flavobacterium sp.]
MKFPVVLLLFFCAPVFVNAQEQFSVYFDTNRHDLKPVEHDRLGKWISDNPEVKIVAINGYTDEDGSTGHNDTLAQKRVNAIHDMVKGKIRIRGDFKKRSFGELHKHSANKAENRKATIYYLLEKDIARENEILGSKPSAEKRVVTYPETITVNNADGSKSEYKLNVEFMTRMTNAKTGEKLTIANLNFVINTFAIVADSRSKLYELLLVLQRNPNLRIDIQGHLCCSPKDHTDLSTKRAKAIYSFLLNNGIDKTRLSYKGFGTNNPLHAIPEKNEEERAANRRVEIEIVGN